MNIKRARADIVALPADEPLAGAIKNPNGTRLIVPVEVGTDDGAVASGAKMVVPSPDTCERQAAQFAGNMPRLQGRREWPALLRMLDRLDPSYRT
jgi:hypothetical protein